MTPAGEGLTHLQLPANMSGGDELCVACARVDLFSLFTGPRFHHQFDFHSRVRVNLGTLQGVWTNVRCPLCRLMKHDLVAQGIFMTAVRNPAAVQCSLMPFRADSHEDTRCNNDSTAAMVATRLQVGLSPMPGDRERHCEGPNSGLRYIRSYGIRLLSPGSVDPARPLLNGFRATTMQNNLALLSQWLGTCCDHHTGSCRSAKSGADSTPALIRVIDVAQRKLVSRDPAAIVYATLSYVWGQNREDHTKLTDELQVQRDSSGNVSIFLPLVAPKVIEDSLFVCNSVSVPYLWVDLYCVHQDDPVKKAAEIKAMGYIYRLSHITFVAGAATPEDLLEPGHPQGLLSTSAVDDLGSEQRIETIGDRTYVSALPSISWQSARSAWNKRGWTFQEGHMARRIAFFGKHDISFLCGAGHWRESLHSGPFGHDANIPGVDLSADAYSALFALVWLKDGWSFRQYNRTLSDYCGRTLSYESDRLDAVSGSFNVIAHRNGIHFLHGLPSAHFHYALLFRGENDRPRAGFPSWSWAGWHADDQTHLVWPRRGLTGCMAPAKNDTFEFKDQDVPDAELGGGLVTAGVNLPYHPNKCSQRLTPLSVSPLSATLTVKSEVVKFSINMIPGKAGISKIRGIVDITPRSARGYKIKEMPPDLDTTSGQAPVEWDQDTEYCAFRGCFRLRDSAGNVHEENRRGLVNSPALLLSLPTTLRGSTLTWLLRDGIELINIVQLKLLEGPDKMTPVDHILGLGIDRTEGIPGHGRRMGIFCLPKVVWDKAEPKLMEVTFS